MVRHAQRLWRFLILAHAILQEENQLHWSRFRNPFLWTKQKVFGASIASNLFFPRVESCLILQKKETHRVHHGCFGRPRSDYHNFPQRLIDLANIVPPWTSKTRISKNACHPLKTNGWKPPKMEDWKDMLFLSKTDEVKPPKFGSFQDFWSINGNEKSHLGGGFVFCFQLPTWGNSEIWENFGYSSFSPASGSSSLCDSCELWPCRIFRQEGIPNTQQVSWLLTWFLMFVLWK